MEEVEGRVEERMKKWGYKKSKKKDKIIKDRRLWEVVMWMKNSDEINSNRKRNQVIGLITLHRSPAQHEEEGRKTIMLWQ